MLSYMNIYMYIKLMIYIYIYVMVLLIIKNTFNNENVPAEIKM